MYKSKMHRLISLAAVLSLFSNPGCTEDGSPKPNIILILADDLGYNDLTCYRETNHSLSINSSTSQTPHIDGLAENGIRFTTFYSGAAVCSPSRGALITGRNSTRLGIYNWIPNTSPQHLRDAEITIAEMLKEHNYATAHFGKWHLTSQNMPQPEPLDQGFDYAFWTHNNASPSHENPTNFIRNRDATGVINGYSCHIVVSEAKKWLETMPMKDQPFYLNLWFHEPHAKVAAPDSLKARHKRNQAYYGCIENMDYAVGNLIQYLKETGRDHNTLILFTSDNGSQKTGSNEPLRGEKCFQYEGGIRVPFIAYWKGKINPKSESNVVGHFTDLLPTIAAITQTQVPMDREIDGQDLSAVLLGEGNDHRAKPIFFYRYFHDPICMLRQGDMILLGYQNRPKSPRVDYDEREEALFKPVEGEATWSQWSFQKSHMEALKLQEPRYFELYNISEDVGQKFEVSKENQELTENMKKTMLLKRKEMIKEGGDWFPHE